MPGAVFPSAVLIYTDSDPALTYSAQWEEAGEKVTQIRGASVTLNFHGTSATLIGHTSNSFRHKASSGSYFIDGTGPTLFTLPGLPSANSETQYNTLVFTTPSLADDFHNVTVVYEGGSEHTPLAVKHWHVTNTTENDAPVQGSPSSSATVNQIPTSASQGGVAFLARRANTGLIVGGVIAGILVVGVLLVVLYILRRRRRVRATRLDGVTYPTIPMHRHVDDRGSSVSPIPMTFPAVSRPASWISRAGSAETWTLHGRDSRVSSTPPSPSKDSWYEQPQLYGLPR